MPQSRSKRDLIQQQNEAQTAAGAGFIGQGNAEEALGSAQPPRPSKLGGLVNQVVKTAIGAAVGGGIGGAVAGGAAGAASGAASGASGALGGAAGGGAATGASTAATIGAKVGGQIASGGGGPAQLPRLPQSSPSPSIVASETAREADLNQQIEARRRRRRVGTF